MRNIALIIERFQLCELCRGWMDRVLSNFYFSENESRGLGCVDYHFWIDHKSSFFSYDSVFCVIMLNLYKKDFESGKSLISLFFNILNNGDKDT